jgi:hypothetical protein
MKRSLKVIYIVALVVLAVVLVGYSPMRASVTRIVSGTTARFYSNISGQKTTLVNVSQNSLINNGSVGLWSFNGPDMSWSLTASSTATDSSGVGNNGDIITGTSASNRQTTVRPGIVGQALNFDGNDDHINITDSASLDITGSITISAWINARSLGDEVIVSKRALSSNVTNYHFDVRTGGELFFAITAML